MNVPWYRVQEDPPHPRSNAIWTLPIAILAAFAVVGLTVPHRAVAQPDNSSRIHAAQYTPPATGKPIELKYDGKTIQVDPKTPLPVIESLQKHQANKQPADIGKLLNGICGGGNVKCTGNQPVQVLEVPASTELLARKQLDAFGRKFPAPELLKIFGQEVAPDELAALSGAVWSQSLSQKDRALLDRWRGLQPGTIEKLLTSLNTQQQTAPGKGVDGTQPLPRSFGDSPSKSLPVLPMPPVSGGAATSCASPPIAPPSILSPVEFGKLYADAQADKPIVFCRDGFLDVLLIDAGGANGVCTAVRVAASWALTARHCVNKDPESVRIFQPTPATLKCLEANPLADCNLAALERKFFPVPADVDIDLALINIPEDRSVRSATIIPFDAGKPFEMTLAGFGQSAGRAAGLLRVGWTEVHEEETLKAMGKGGKITLGPLVTIERKAGDAALRSWSCPGDSGAPFFAGRVFGWADEPHNVVAINVRGTAEGAGCRPKVEDGTNTGFVFLHQAEVRKWLCSTTGNAIEMCK